MGSLGHRIGSFIIALATALAIIAVVIPLFLNPAWVSFEQGRAEAAAWTGFPETDLRAATDAILADLVVGPPDFDVAIGGAAVLDERERSHMRDVRSVFIDFYVVTAVLVMVAVALVVRRGRGGRVASWRAVRSGAFGLIVGLLTLGLFALVAFDSLFEIFHRLFFAGGTYTFDPATERLVQLFPFQFWQETAIVLGVVAILVAILMVVVANAGMTRAGRVAATATATTGPGGPDADPTTTVSGPVPEPEPEPEPEPAREVPREPEPAREPTPAREPAP